MATMTEALGVDGLALVAATLRPSDVLAFALTCKDLRDAQKAARLELKTMVSDVHFASPACHLWAKALGCPLPKQPSEMFASAQMHRGLFDNDATRFEAGDYTLIPLTEEEYGRVAFAHGTIAFVAGFDFWGRGTTDEDAIFHQAKGYFTVRDLCEALAKVEEGYDGNHVFFEGIEVVSTAQARLSPGGPERTVHVLRALWGS